MRSNVTHESRLTTQALFYRIPQFINESKSERIIEIGPHFAKAIVKIKVAPKFLALGVDPS